MISRLATCLGLVLFAASCTKGSKDDARAPTTVVSDDARKTFARAVEHMDAGATRYDQAVVDFQAALQLAPDLWEAHLNIGIIELRRARLVGAAQALERSIAIYPSTEALEALGEVYVRQGRAKEAVTLYERALVSNPDDLRLRNRLALALRHAGRLDDAEAELRAILGRDAGDIDAYCTLAGIQIDRGKLDVAELVLNKGLLRHPDEPRMLTNLGLVALRRGDDQAAFGLFEKASAKDPAFLLGRLNKAAVLLGAGDHIRAREELSAVLAVEPGNTQALLAMGIAKRLAGDLADARASWEAVLAIEPENLAATFNLAILAMDFQDQPALARTHLERYLQLAADSEPQFAAAKERLELLEAMQSQDKP